MDLDLICESSNRNDYLIETDLINYSHPSIKAKADEISQNAANEVEFAHQAFEFVRDEVYHSWDIQSPRVTIRASDVLKYKEGICYAKSLLLCALLRNKGIPTGFCYQRLTWGTHRTQVTRFTR
jgi:transglutaminase-like putative cysteine protease